MTALLRRRVARTIGAGAAALAAFTPSACTTEQRRTEPQILLYVDTDAPVPASVGAKPSVDAPLPLFDRVRIEIFPPGSAEPCEGCVNEFAIQADLFRDRAASIGIASPPGVPGYRARVRMFLGLFVAGDGTPDPDATVEATIALPPIGDEGRLELSVILGTGSVGAPIGSLDEPIAPLSGRPKASLVGTWPGAVRTPCAREPAAGQVCLPGGAYWMGGVDGPWSIVSERDTHRPRLVVLSPFFLDATEVTVKMFRTEKTVTPSRYWTGGKDGTDIIDFCTATPDPGSREDLPVACVTRAAAVAYCAAKGRTLPSEAQFEYAAGGILGRRYVWGEDPPRCPDAIYSRTGWGILEEVTSVCRPPSPPGGPAIVGSGSRDRLELAGGAAVVDLAGNVSELMQDTWNRHDESCWSTPGIYLDPVCTSRSREGALSLARGGDWASGSSQLLRTVRLNFPGGTFFSPQIGFRCAEAATE